VSSNPLKTQSLPFLPPLGLYVHLPWCIRKCPYCDFNSHALNTAADPTAQFEHYVDALIADLEDRLPEVWGRSVHAIFLGGGTPSLFPPQSVGRLLDAVRSRLRLLGGAEVTLEANPGSFEVERFEGFRAAGVNRLSLGVQSFSDDCLVRIGRVHDAAQALRAAEAAVRSFDRVNIDLMFGQPGQQLEDLERDLKLLASLGVGHVSLYQFTLEANTYFARQPPQLMPTEPLLEAMQQLIDDTVPALGLLQYEVSAWARPEQQCQHNRNTWQFGDYLGIGAGAHSKISDHEGIWRQVRMHHPELYMQQMLGKAAPSLGEERLRIGPPAPGRRLVAARDLPFEFMLNVLRLREGVPAAFFPERTGIAVSQINRVVARAVDRGLLDADPRVWRSTPLGWRFLNELQMLFLDPTEEELKRCAKLHV